MFFPTAISIEDNKAYVVTLPDSPGGNTAGDKLGSGLEL